MKEALFYEKLPGNEVKCTLCHRFCVVSDGEIGFCKAYENVDGGLVSLTYGRPIHVGRIDSRFSIWPAIRDYSSVPWFGRRLIVSTPFCNFRCKECSNIVGSFTEMPFIMPRSHDCLACFDGLTGSFKYVVEASPSDIVALALRQRCDAIRFAYNEITVFYEYMLDIAKLAKKEGIQIWVETNGYLTSAPIDALAPYVDVIVVSFKASGNKAFYADIGIPDITPIFETVEHFKRLQVWTVIVDLLIEQFDSYETVYDFGREVVKRFGRDQRLLFELAVSPETQQRRAVPPLDERMKKVPWAIPAALYAGLHDVLFVDSVPSAAQQSSQGQQNKP